jgi:hypothetical protein
VTEPAALVYWIQPRYLEGTPHSVDEASALQLASREAAAYAKALSGVEGEDRRSQANLGGLGGIVEMRLAVPGGWEVVDLIQGKRFFRPSHYRVVPRHKSRED